VRMAGGVGGCGGGGLSPTLRFWEQLCRLESSFLT
jgi:hypothetical protein